MRSGTSIGANVIEAQSGQSKKDFLSKIYIALKEANETKYRIELLIESKLVKNINFQHIKELNIELIKILTSITKTTTSNLKLNI